jgi:hypothetical protein
VSDAVTLVASGVLMAMPGAASAVTHVHAKYTVTGSTFIKAPNFTLAGSYTIGKFQHCGLATLLINLTIPGSGNTIKLTLGKAHLG